MGGTSGKIEADNLLEAINKLFETKTYVENEIRLNLDSVTILAKKGKGYVDIGNNGIEVAVNKTYGEKPTKRFVVLYHFGN